MKKKKRISILYVIYNIVVGGVENILYSIIENIDLRKFNIHLVFCGQGSVINYFKPLRDRARLYSIDRPPKEERLEDILKNNKIDIMQSNYFELFGTLAARRARVRHIWYIPGLLSVALPNSSMADRRNRLRIIYNFSDTIIAISKAARNQFKSIDVKKMDLIYPGIDTETSVRREKLIKFKKQLGLKSGDKLISMVANMSPQKRHEDFIIAAKEIRRRFDSVKFIIAGANMELANGKIEGSHLKKLKTLVSVLKMNEEIRFLGFCENIPELMALTDIFVLPSVDEGFGLAVIEAMAAGKPVVASNSGGIKEIITDGRSGILIPPGDYGALAKAVINLIDDPAKARRIGIFARKTAEKKFNIKCCIKNFIIIPLSSEFKIIPALNGSA